MLNKKTIPIMLLAFMMLLGCGTKTSKDIDPEKIETACDCLDASQIILNDLLAFKDKFISIQNQLMQPTIDAATENRLDREIEYLGSNIQTVIEKYMLVMQVCEKIPQQEYAHCDLTIADLQKQFEEIQFMFAHFMK